MSFRTTVHESLPYIDPEPTSAERSAAQLLIDAELSSTTSTTTSQDPPLPAALPPLREPRFSPLAQSELERVSRKQKLDAIDLSRYEEQELPSSSSPFSDLRTALARAYTTSTYLSHRQQHLQLLDRYGKNAWLVGNWQVEAELQALERELDETKKEMDVVNIQRRRVQDEVGGELRGLDETWRRGVGRVLETEAAAETLRQQVLERQRTRGGE